jgi:hypothetical protein
MGVINPPASQPPQYTCPSPFVSDRQNATLQTGAAMRRLYNRKLAYPTYTSPMNISANGSNPTMPLIASYSSSKGPVPATKRARLAQTQNLMM